MRDALIGKARTRRGATVANAAAARGATDEKRISSLSRTIPRKRYCVQGFLGCASLELAAKARSICGRTMTRDERGAGLQSVGGLTGCNG